MSKGITVQMLIKNEDRFIWYSIAAILPFADKVLIYDTGSTDKTLKIINLYKSPKIVLKRKNIHAAYDIGMLRNEQLNETQTDWVWIVDGDEVYPQSLINEILDIIKSDGKDIEGIVVRRLDLLGDIYHFQNESVGEYNLFGKKGHLVLRLLNKKNITGLHVGGTYPREYYLDGKGEIINNHKPANYRFTKGKLFHGMYLQRSSKGANLSDTYHRKKSKIELGKAIAEDIKIPEVFFQKRPDIVESALEKRSLGYKIAASFITPVKIFKRKMIRS